MIIRLSGAQGEQLGGEMCFSIIHLVISYSEGAGIIHQVKWVLLAMDEVNSVQLGTYDACVQDKDTRHTT